jgi:hypothetical protein
MDGSSPSGFKNSTFCGMNCTGNETTPNPPPGPSPCPTPGPTPGPSPISPNTIVDYSTVKIKSLYDLFTKSTDIWSFMSLFWYNMWVLFVWF